MSSITTHFDLIKPEVDGDPDEWGADLNESLDLIDAALYAHQELIAASAPTGAILDFLQSTAPSGWLALDGSTIGSAASGASHANGDAQALFSVIWALSATAAPILDSGGSASTRGGSAAADWSANKRLTLPDLRGRFRRMTGGSAGTLGEPQADAVRDHTHPFSINQGGTFAGSGPVSYLQGTTVSASGTYSGTTGNGGGGAETRPVNVAVLACVKL